MQRLHSRPPALLAKKPGLPWRVIRRAFTERGGAQGAAIKARQPATQPHSPERKVTQGQGPIAGPLNLAHGEQDQPEHRLGHLMVRQHQLRSLADDRQSSAQLVVALRLVKRLQEFALLDPHQLPRLLLHIPDLYVRKDLQRRAVAVLYPPCSAGNTANTAGRASKKAHQAVGLAQRKSLQDNGFRFPGGHFAVGAPTLRRTPTEWRGYVRIARTRRAKLIITRARPAQIILYGNRGHFL